MRKRISKAEFERIQEIRRKAVDLKGQLDELEDEALDIFDCPVGEEEPTWDAMMDFIYNKGTVADLLLELDIAVEGDDEHPPTHAAEP